MGRAKCNSARDSCSSAVAPAAPPLSYIAGDWISVILASRLIGFTTSRARPAPPAPADSDLEELFQGVSSTPSHKK